MKRALQRFAWAALAMVAGAVCAPPGMSVITPAAAAIPGVTCMVTATSINFGNMDPRGKSANTNLSTTGFITFYCSNLNPSAETFTACISLGNPDGNVARQMHGSKPSNVLPYDLYQDVARTTTWGSRGLPTWGSPASVSVTAPAGGNSVPITLPVYASIVSQQDGQNSSTAADTYVATYGPNDAVLDVVPSGSNCASATGTGDAFSFPMVAIVTQTCQVDTNPLIFNVQNGAPSGATATTTFTVSCSKQSGYQVGLDFGKNVAGDVRRMRGGPTHNDYVSYRLFQNAGHSVPWGNTPNEDTVGGAGTSSTFTIYGKVDPDQGMPSGGDYFDAVTVYVYF